MNPAPSDSNNIDSPTRAAQLQRDIHQQRLLLQRQQQQLYNVLPQAQSQPISSPSYFTLPTHSTSHQPYYVSPPSSAPAIGIVPGAWPSHHSASTPPDETHSSQHQQYEHEDHLQQQHAGAATSAPLQPPQPKRAEDTAPPTSDFVEKVYRMLENPSFQSAVCWGPMGDCFIVKDVDEFTKLILPRLFKHSNFASFVRQLNKYDFHKVKKTDDNEFSEHSWIFRHPHFHANSRDGLENIKRKVPVQRKQDTRVTSASGIATAANPLSTTIPNAPNNHRSYSNQSDHIGQAPSRTHENLMAEIQYLKDKVENLSGLVWDLERRYESVLEEMVGLHQVMAQQGGLMQTLIGYFLGSEGSEPKAPSVAGDTPNSTSGGPVAGIKKYNEREREPECGKHPGIETVIRAGMNNDSERQDWSGMTNDSERGGQPRWRLSDDDVALSSSVGAMGESEDASMESSPGEFVMPSQQSRSQSQPSFDSVPAGNVPSRDLPMEEPPNNWVLDTSGPSSALISGGPGLGGVGDWPPTTGVYGSESEEETVIPTPQGATSDALRTEGSKKELVRQSTLAPGWAVSPRVLVVDDDAITRKLSSKFLEFLGCSIDVAVDGISAVKKMNSERYDLVLMDIVMPKLDGVAATSLIRKFNQGTPIISMTSNSRPTEIMSYYSSGMNDILAKPFTKQGLLNVLEKHLMHLKVIQQLSKVPRSVGVPPLSDANFEQALTTSANNLLMSQQGSPGFRPLTHSSSLVATDRVVNSSSPFNFQFFGDRSDGDAPLNPLAGMGVTDEQYNLILQNFVNGEDLFGTTDSMNIGAGYGFTSVSELAKSSQTVAPPFWMAEKRPLEDEEDQRDRKRSRFEVIE